MILILNFTRPHAITYANNQNCNLKSLLFHYRIKEKEKLACYIVRFFVRESSRPLTAAMAFFTKRSLHFQGTKNKNVFHWVRSARSGRNCALDLEYSIPRTQFVSIGTSQAGK